MFFLSSTTLLLHAIAALLFAALIYINYTSSLLLSSPSLSFLSLPFFFLLASRYSALTYFLQFLYLSFFTLTFFITIAGVLASLQMGPFYFALQASTDHFRHPGKKNQKKMKKKENLNMKERKVFAPIFLYGLS
jgi:hypothetical protein